MKFGCRGELYQPLQVGSRDSNSLSERLCVRSEESQSGDVVLLFIFSRENHFDRAATSTRANLVQPVFWVSHFNKITSVVTAS